MKYLKIIGYSEKKANLYLNEQILNKNIQLKNGELCADTTQTFDDELLHGSFHKKNLPLISCFSKCFDNVLMWSHYAQKHEGVCLIYTGVFQKKQYVLFCEEIEGALFSFEKINYSNIKPKKVNRIKDLANKKLISALVTKSSEWEYEDEYRLVLKNPTPNEKGVALKFDKHHLRGVIFGMKTSQEDKKSI